MKQYWYGENGAVKEVDKVTHCEHSGVEIEKEKVESEVILDSFLFTYRFKVDGGWIYNSIDKSNGIGTSVFVPCLEELSK